MDVGPGKQRTEWDVKSFPSLWFTPKINERRAYSDAAATESINKELKKGVNVVMDTGRLYPGDRESLERLIRHHPEWAGKVLVY